MTVGPVGDRPGLSAFEGIFREHMIMPTGPLRDSAWYSVISAEWPAVRDGLWTSLDRPTGRHLR